MHDNVMKVLNHLYTTAPHDGPILEIGSININGSARDVYGHITPYVGIDIVPGPNVDIVVDITDELFSRFVYPELLHDFKTIICTEVLEHTPPEYLVPAMIKHFCAQPGSEYTIIITCAGPGRKPHSADGSPNLKYGEYYKNVDPLQLSELLYMVPDDALTVLQCTVWSSIDGTDVYAIARYRRSDT